MYFEFCGFTNTFFVWLEHRSTLSATTTFITLIIIYFAQVLISVQINECIFVNKQIIPLKIRYYKNSCIYKNNEIFYISCRSYVPLIHKVILNHLYSYYILIFLLFCKTKFLLEKIWQVFWCNGFSMITLIIELLWFSMITFFLRKVQRYWGGINEAIAQDLLWSLVAMQIIAINTINISSLVPAKKNYFTLWCPWTMYQLLVVNTRLYDKLYYFNL